MFRFRREVCLDHNATTALSRPARRRMSQVLETVHGNPSSVHGPGRAAAAVLEESRAQVAQTLGCSPAELCFTGSASEANNAVIKGLFDLFAPRKKKIVSTPIEHPSVLGALEHLQTRGARIEYLPLASGGKVAPEALASLIDEDTFLVCCALANNEIGTVQDLLALGEVCRRRGALLLCDCVQALGKVPLEVGKLGADYATFSAHKLGGPKGVGALYVKEGSPFQPLIHGGAQESGRRAGTEGIHNIAGFAEACRGVGQLLSRAEAVRALRDELVAGLRALRPDLVVNSPSDACLGNTASITFSGVNNALLVAALDFHGIAVSAGSACHTQSNEPSHVLKAIGLTDEQARQTVRLSLGAQTSAADLRYALRVFGDFFADRLPAIGVITPAQLGEETLLKPETFILDVRFPHDRKLLKSLPNAHEASFFSFRALGSLVPRDSHVIVACQAGMSAPIVAYQLRAKGYRRVSFLLGGMAGWRLRQPALYEKLAGRTIAPGNTRPLLQAGGSTDAAAKGQ